mgnify:CR=1 FL=1
MNDNNDYETYEELQQEIDRRERLSYLIDVIRKEEHGEAETNEAFAEIQGHLQLKIQKIVSKCSISGMDDGDVMQEALYALRFKAINDYDSERGTDDLGVADFDRFALLCIRRHLATKFKSSLQGNRFKVLNDAFSLDQEDKGTDRDLAFINILSSSNLSLTREYDDVLSMVEEGEYYNNLMNLLLKKLSEFEKQVLILYAQKFSYEEIAEQINKNRMNKLQTKSIDNALSRIKTKARAIRLQYEEKNEE